jgi:hypothetical protein
MANEKEAAPAARRPNAPKNPEKLKMMLIEELELFFPIEPDWAIVGCCINPRTGAMIIRTRQDGVPTANPPLSGGRLIIALEDSADEIEQTAHDFEEYFKSKGKKAHIGFYPSAKAEMKIIRCEA